MLEYRIKEGETTQQINWLSPVKTNVDIQSVNNFLNNSNWNLSIPKSVSKVARIQSKDLSVEKYANNQHFIKLSPLNTGDNKKLLSMKWSTPLTEEEFANQPM